jgi:hypothetical protein
LSESGLGRWPSSATAPQQQHPDGQQLAGVRRSATFPSTAAPRTAPQDSHRADGHTPALLSRDAAHDQAPAAGEAALPPLPPSAPKAKQKNMAMKFLSKLGSKKEKYSGKQKAELEVSQGGWPRGTPGSCVVQACAVGVWGSRAVATRPLPLPAAHHRGAGQRWRQEAPNPGVQAAGPQVVACELCTR